MSTRGDRRRGLLATLAAVAVLAAACTGEPAPEPKNESKPAKREPHVAIPPVFAYATDTGVALMNGGKALTGIELSGDEYVTDAEWTADGTRFVVATSARVVSVDTKTGATKTASCTCESIAVADGKVYTSRYGTSELTAYALPALSKAGTVRPDLDGGRGLLSIDGAGDRLVLFHITADGARPLTDVLVLDPATDELTTMGRTDDIGTPSGGVYTPRGWQGTPAYAYIANASSGATTGLGSIVWFDPTGTRQQTVANDRHLRVETPPLLTPERFNTGRDHLWWAADGSLHTTAWTWACQSLSASSDPQCHDLLPHQQWRYDGGEWTRADDRDLASVRGLADGTTLELANDNALALVDGDERTPVASEVRRLWTPALPAPAVERGSQEMAERLAPQVRMHTEEKNFPGDATEFVDGSRLLFYHEGNCHEVVADEVEEEKLARGEYRNPAGTGKCGNSVIGKVYRSDESAVEEDKRLGFALDLANDEAVRKGHEPVDDAVTAPVYWQYVPGDRPGKGAYVYWLFYHYNVFNNLHEGDWEKVAVQVDGDRPQAVVFWKHKVSSCHVPWQDLDNVDGHPVTYSAKGSHASYPTAGSFPRFDGKQFGTDIASDDGARWSSWQDVRPTSTQRWYGYRGLWGDVVSADFPLRDSFEGIGGPNPGRKINDAFPADRCQLQAIPKALLGTWKSTGPVQDQLNDAEYTMTVDIGPGSVGETVGTVTFDGLDCRASWTLVGGDPGVFSVREKRETDGNQQCATTGIAQLAVTSAGLSYSYQPEQRPGPATADLVRAGTEPAAPATEGAIARYERFLHAVGAADVPTVCEIVGDALEKENPGLGSCETIAGTGFTLLSAAQKQAFRGATVDPKKVIAQGGTVRIPASAVRAAAPLTADDIGDTTMSYRDGQWYATELS
jgi:hypothetical protein